jgi:hypothetical protein
MGYDEMSVLTRNGRAAFCYRGFLQALYEDGPEATRLSLGK